MPDLAGAQNAWHVAVRADCEGPDGTSYVTEIEAAGSQTDDSGETTALEFGYSWVELLAKREGRWLRVGNASSARP